LSTTLSPSPSFFFFFHHPPPSVFYTLSLHDALPISVLRRHAGAAGAVHHRIRRQPVDPPLPAVRPDRAGERALFLCLRHGHAVQDRKSTRLNSSHLVISYAVFCLKKKKKNTKKNTTI